MGPVREWNIEYMLTPPAQDWRPLPDAPEYLIGSRGWVWSRHLDRCLATSSRGKDGLARARIRGDSRSVHALAYEAYVGPYPTPDAPTNHLPVEREQAEQWRPMLSFEEKYLVSDEGRVWSIGRERLLTHVTTPNNYLVVCLSAPPSRTTRKVHRLVLEAFVGPCPEGMETRHLNGDRQENRLANLAWGTALENAADLKRHGRNYYACRDRCPHGHRYVPENTLVERSRGRVSRKCRACVWARNRTRSGEGPRRRTLADSRYRTLVAKGRH